MTADDLRLECKKNVEIWNRTGVTPNQLVEIAKYGAMVEIAAQLADLNKQVGYLVPRPIIRETNG